MRLTDILSPDCVKVPLEAVSKQEAIFELVDLLAGHAGLADPEELRQAVWQREKTRTTGIGHGVAIPHGKCKGIERLAMAVGIPAQPLEFGAIDGRPVEVVLLLGSPLDQTGPHIQALAGVSKLLTDEETRNAIKSAKSAHELYQIIAQNEARTAV